MHFWEKVKILLIMLLVMLLVMILAVMLTGCGMDEQGEIVPSGRISWKNFGLPERTEGEIIMSVTPAEASPNVAAQENREDTSEVKQPMEGMSWGSAFLEDQEFIYFYSGCKIWKISRESKEAVVLWESSPFNHI